MPVASLVIAPPPFLTRHQTSTWTAGGWYEFRVGDVTMPASRATHNIKVETLTSGNALLDSAVVEMSVTAGELGGVTLALDNLVTGELTSVQVRVRA